MTKPTLNKREIVFKCPISGRIFRDVTTLSTRRRILARGEMTPEELDADTLSSLKWRAGMELEYAKKDARRARKEAKKKAATALAKKLLARLCLPKRQRVKPKPQQKRKQTS